MITELNQSFFASEAPLDMIVKEKAVLHNSILLAGFFKEKFRLIDWRWSGGRVGGRRPQLG